MSLRVYHTSDLHDHRGIAPRLRAMRSERPGLLFDCGDSLRGSQTIYYASEPIVEDIDAAGYDAQGMGNREFHYVFRAVAARARKMQHPLLCSNLVDTKGRTLPFRATLDLVASDASDPGVAIKIRLFSLLVVQYPEGSPWERFFGWRFHDPFETAARVAAETPDDVTLIALSHVGLRADRILAERVPRIDLILGGHSHDTLHAPLVHAGVPIVHAGPYGRYVSSSELAARGTSRARLERSELLPLLGVR